MDPFLLWLESSALSVWVRESPSLFAFPGILALHALGMAFVAGINAVLALRILGVARGIPIRELGRFMPVMWAGFWVNAASGLVLLVGYPTKALTNPLFYVKLVLLALGIFLLQQIARRTFRAAPGALPAVAPRLHALAIASLVCWIGTIVSGRFLAYTYTRLMADL